MTGLAAYAALLAILVASTLDQEGSSIRPGEAAAMTYTLAASMAYAFPLGVGVLIVTNEFRHRTIMPTLLAQPRKSVIIGAKVATALAVGVLYGLVGTLACAVSGAAVFAMQGLPHHLFDAGTIRAIAASVLLLTIWSGLGACLGVLMTNQGLAIVTVLAFTQFAEPLVRLMLGSTSIGGRISSFLPGAAGEAMVGTSFLSVSASAPLLEPWQGLAVLIGYGGLFMIAGRLTTLRRDLT
jgi:ABC-type transport system involved in multi-copper enzyme maturation permease subunit